MARKRRRSLFAQAGTPRQPTHYPANLRPEHEAKYDAVREKKVLKSNVLINWGLVVQYVSTTQFDHYFEDEAWKNLLDIQEEVYSALTYEFVATFKISFPRASGLRNPISFYCQG